MTVYTRKDKDRAARAAIVARVKAGKDYPEKRDALAAVLVEAMVAAPHYPRLKAALERLEALP